MAPIHTNFEGERAPIKRDFLVHIFQKVPNNAFLAYFFEMLPAAPKQGLFSALGEFGKSVWLT